MKHRRIFWTIALIVGLFAILTLSQHLPLREFREQTTALLSANPIAAPVIFIGLYILFSLFFIPASLLTASAGVVFSPWYAIGLVSLASLFGAASSFAVARFFGQRILKDLMQRSPRLRYAEDLISNNGIKVVIMLRILPIFPFSFVNYAVGLSKIPFLPFILISWLTMLPGTAVYIIGIDTLKQTLTGGEIDWRIIVVGVFFLAVSLVAGWQLNKRYRGLHISPPGADGTTASALQSQKKKTI